MKNNIKKILMLGLAFGLTLSACQKDFQAINTDPIGIKDPDPAKLLAPAIITTVAQGMSRNRSFNNELMHVTVTISDAETTVFRYQFLRSTSDYLWNSWYPQITNLKDVYTRASEPARLNKSYQGISLVMQSWLYANLTDIYGDIPFSQSNQLANGIVEPKFDKQKDVYLGIFKMLEEANTLLSANTPIVPISDPLYRGDVVKWRKFCNSLYLRLLLRISGKSEVSAQVIAKMKEIVNTNSANYPIMENNSESASVEWNGGVNVSDPYTSPWVSVREQDFRASAMGKFFMDNLVRWGDPRIDISAKYSNGGINAWGISQGPLGFAGVQSGYSQGTGIIKQSWFYSTASTQSSKPLNERSLQANPRTGTIMSYAELQFILAEATVKNYITGNAESYYNSGVASAINYWVPNFSASATSQELIDYLTAGDILFGTYGLGTDDDKMEQIHLQKYYALFTVDLQQWFEYRRTGHPILPKGTGLANGGVMPARMVYPIYLLSVNPTSYKEAVASIGPDEIYTQVWWQKP